MKRWLLISCLLSVRRGLSRGSRNHGALIF